MAKHLDGQRILILEDEYLAALDMSLMIEQQGGTVVGPAGRLEQAQALVLSEALDAAILDVKMNGDYSFDLADDLISQGVPVIFATGYDIRMLPERFAGTSILAKPITVSGLERALREVFAAA